MRMQSTTRHEPHPTLNFQGTAVGETDEKLVSSYDGLIKSRKLSWTGHYHLIKLLDVWGRAKFISASIGGRMRLRFPLR